MDSKLIERDQTWWDRWFLGLAQYYSTASKDPSTQVGACLVNDRRIVVGTGYNGFPRGVKDLESRLANREEKYQFIQHAERNAIQQAGDKADGCTLYVYPAFMMPPICNECVKSAIQAGVKVVVGFEPDLNDPRVQRWKDSIAIARIMCEEVGITWRVIPNKTYSFKGFPVTVLTREQLIEAYGLISENLRRVRAAHIESIKMNSILQDAKPID